MEVTMHIEQTGPGHDTSPDLCAAPVDEDIAHKNRAGLRMPLIPI